MKLNKPITVTITHVANAVITRMYLDPSFPAPYSYPNTAPILAASESIWQTDKIRSQIERGLVENGIDWRSWTPTPPVTIAGRQCEFNSDGTVKLSCGTVISNEEIEAFLKNRSDANGSEWPKYFLRGLSLSGKQVVRCWSNTDDGERFECGWNKFMDGVPLLDCAENTPHIYKPISRAQAAAMIGAENLSK